MKIALIIVALKESEKDAKKVVMHFEKSNLGKIRAFIVINQRGKEGYAQGVNKGIKLSKNFKPDIYIVANPDITDIKLTKMDLKDGFNQYDLWGYLFKQGNNTYYGGKIDPYRLTGHLLKSPGNIDFVSGSLMFFTKKTLKKLGNWDENYHMYYEDVDYSNRAINAGLNIGIVNKIAYKHLEMSKFSKEKELNITKSWVRYFVNNAGLKNWVYEILRLPKTIFKQRDLIFQQVKNRPFFYNFLTLNFTSLTIKVLNFLLFLFLVRYFSTTQFGLYNLVWAQIGLFMPLSDLGTTNYGIFHLNRYKKIAFSNLFSLRLLLSVFIALVTILYTFIIFQQKELLILTLLSTPVVLANAITGSFLIYTTLLSKTYLASIYSLIFNTALIAMLIGLVVGKYGLRTLFFAEGLWFGIYAIFIWFKTKKLISFKFNWPTFNYLKDITSKSYMYILLNFFAGLYFKIDLLILQYFKGYTAVGIYSSGFKFFEALIFLGASYTIAATPIYKKHLIENKLAVKKKLVRDSVILFGLGMIVATSCWFVAPVLLPYVLGKEFLGGVDVFRIVIFALPFLLVSAVCMNVLYLLKKVHWVVMIFVLQIFLNIFGNVIFVPLFSYQASAIITVLCEVMNTALTVPLVFKAYENLS